MSKCGCGGCGVGAVAKWLLVIGGLNWGLVGVNMLMGGNGMDWNLVYLALGGMPMVEAIVYVLVGVAAVVKVVGCRCSKCKAACATCGVEEKAGAGMQ